MSDAFPAVGHKYLVDFRAASGRGFRVQLDFASEASLTYTGIDAQGHPIPDSSETVDITVTPIRDLLFLVTWQEREGTTVVHLEDYRMNTIITNITEPPGKAGDRPAFSTFHGTMSQVA
ncbi:Protein of unknown function [Bradyrhizobium sp. ORS 285]|uniref:MoaF-related domain-containing protein n=1 Tax=Bradyrhizobium sp. ORS 285 TaxID=115808 RepID=UPI00024072A4|nr:hypothetical protein [Bradyrhizobium sp. ORS 285]CCD84936.1 Protein of unknown function [Bradyrhizobium sp. ORS 285]SMX62298.1 Protein of unknown function [Bradyrhizobium sp. ORS 285]